MQKSMDFFFNIPVPACFLASIKLLQVIAQMFLQWETIYFLATTFWSEEGPKHAFSFYCSRALTENQIVWVSKLPVRL